MKNKIKSISIILLCVFSINILWGCATEQTETGNSEKNREIVLGKWENDIFTNEWANFTFELPNNITPLTEDEMESLFNSNNVLVNGDETDSSSETVHTYFDFALKDSNGVICVCVYYVDYYEETYVDMQISTFAHRLIQGFKERNSDYTASEITVSQIGELDDCISFTITMNEYITITYYVNKIDGFFNVWQISEYERQSEDLHNFLNSVKKVN